MSTLDNRYEAVVPDTLDLAERAGLAVNALTGSADPERNYESYLCAHMDNRPAYFSHGAGGPCLPKPVQALPMMRVMSGSALRAGHDRKMLESGLQMIEDDGLLWLKVEGRPGFGDAWHRDLALFNTNPRFMITLLDWHRYDGNARWLEVAGRLAEGMARVAMRKEDRAWYFLCYSREGWRKDTSPSAQIVGDAHEPTVEEPERAAAYVNGQPLRAFSRWYAETGESKWLDLAHSIARFMLKPTNWGTPEGPVMVAQPEQAMWNGHFHSQTYGMKGLLEYAIVSHDTRAAEFVARFYEWGRHFGISRIGFFPAVIGSPQMLNRHRSPDPRRNPDEFAPQVSEGCCVGDMTWLAVRMSEAGIGDYWEDVDQYVRNHLVEHQLIRRDLLEATIAAGPEHELDRRIESDQDVLERNIGSFASGSDPTCAYAWWTMCCNANMPVGMYEAWKAIVQGSGDVAQVNLLLNRASEWLDVDSYLPYEGKVVLRIKTARRVRVRIPRWADKSAVRCRVDERELSALDWLGNYLLIDGLAPAQVVAIEFPLVETVEKHAEKTYGLEYTCRLKGNTLVDISPRPDAPAWADMASDDGGQFAVNKGYPLYLRDFYNADEAPLKTAERYVAPRLI